MDQQLLQEQSDLGLHSLTKRSGDKQADDFVVICALTHISLASFLWDISKKCKTRSDAAKCGVRSGSPLFAYRSFFENVNKNEK